MRGLELETVGFTILILGVLLIIIGILGLTLKSFKRGNVEGGGVVIIGPIPIVFSSSQKVAGWLILLAVLFFVFILIINLYLAKLW